MRNIGHYWSSSLCPSDNGACAYELDFQSNWVTLSDYGSCYSGFTVRPVSD